MKVMIDLQEGFVNDEVEIFDQQQKVFEAKNVTTKTQIGFAASAELDIKRDTTTLRINIPSRSLSEEKDLQVKDDLHIGVNLTQDNRLEIKVSDTPFYYL